MKVWLSMSFLALLPTLASPSEGGVDTPCPKVKIEMRRLPDLSVPRSGHALFCANGELTVVGGHTSGFVPTPTAEYYRDGKWHLLHTVYTHDDGLFVPLSTGKVLIAGGHQEPLGIGQTFTAEMYDPTTHSFEGFGCLDRKRSMANGTEIDSGKVVIAGNWYADDAIEVFDGKESFLPAREGSAQRSLPYVLPASDGDALIFGSSDNKGGMLSGITVDRLKAPPLHVPILDTRSLPFWGHCFSAAQCRIDDSRGNGYAFLLPVVDKEGQTSIVLVQDTLFSLLPTDVPVPKQFDNGTDTIIYSNSFVCDRQEHRAYLCGIGNKRIYVLCVQYAKMPVQLTLYYTAALSEPLWVYPPVLTDDGNLVMAGGSVRIGVKKSSTNNFTPSANVFLLDVRQAEESAVKGSTAPLWHWMLMAGLVLAAIVAGGFTVMVLRKKRATRDAGTASGPTPISSSRNLAGLICQLMEQQQLFLQPDLKVSDVASMLSTNSRYVSESIKSEYNATFTQFVNTYRIRHAQELLRENPNIKIITLCMSSGFNVESTFFRAFKAVTGVTPKEWIAQMTTDF